MSNVKASDIVIIRDMLKEAGENQMNALAADLRPEVFQTFKSALSVNWVPIEVEADIIQAAAKLLFPNDQRPVFKLGHAVSGKQFTGLYRFFLRIPSVSFIVKNISATFNTMNDKGSCRVDGLTSKGGTFVIADLPEMSPVQREYICGVITCVLELTGVKNIKVDKIDSTPNEWKWKISWE